jgi:hypothetical protein
VVHLGVGHETALTLWLSNRVVCLHDQRRASLIQQTNDQHTHLSADDLARAVLAGVTGGPVRGVTNHFIPVKPFSTGNKNTELFPGVWKKKVP